MIWSTFRDLRQPQPSSEMFSSHPSGSEPLAKRQAVQALPRVLGLLGVIASEISSGAVTVILRSRLGTLFVDEPQDIVPLSYAEGLCLA